MWTEVDAARPKLLVNPPIAVLAEVCKPKIEPRDEQERRNEDEQGQRLMPVEQHQGDKRSEYDRCTDSGATMPEPLLVR
jgi:hypothetical protein